MKLLIRSIACILLSGWLMSCEKDPVSVEPVKDEWAVSYTVDSAYSRTVRFKLHIPKNIYLLSVHWDFGDGTTARLKPDAEVVHTYKRGGDYVVRAASDPTDSAIVSDTTWVRLRSTVTDFRVNYRVDPADDQLVHFWLLYPTNFFADSIDWNFGDGTIRRIHTDSTHSHKYKRAEDYQVVVSYDHREPTSVIDTVLVTLLNYATEFNVRYWLDPADPTTVHFNLTYPKGFAYDSLYWDFGDGTNKWIAADTSVTHDYETKEDYDVRVSSDMTDDAKVNRTVSLSLSPRVNLDQLRSFNTVKVTFDLGQSFTYSTLGPTAFATSWKGTVLDTSSLYRRITIDFNEGGILDLSSRFLYSGNGWTESEEYVLRKIFCQSISDSGIVYYIGTKSGLQRLESYSYSVWWSQLHYFSYGLQDALKHFKYAKLEFYNR